MSTQAVAVIEDAVPAAEMALSGPPRPEPTTPENYSGASLLRLESEEAEQLAAPFPDEALDIKPTGEVFVSQVHYRRRLNRVFGPGQWALVPRGKWTRDGDTMMREYVLYVRGHFVAEAVGECEYQESNERMSWADAAEGCKSNALTRACKDLGIASECWDRHFANGWREANCIHVWVEGKKKPLWRRVDAPRFYGEGTPTKDWALAHGSTVTVAEPRPVPPGPDLSGEEWPNDPTAHERHGLEPPRPTPAKHTSAPNVSCPQCGKPSGSSKYPKEGKTHYCGACRLSFAPGGAK